ncbi:MAG: type I pullulanase [Clostridia bacterium]|nr:type I pullulanase [Clostridia bacterium]
MKRKILALITVCFFTLGIIVGFGPLTVRSEGKTTVKIHYYRADGDYSKWNVWMWADGVEGKAYNFTEEDEYGTSTNVVLPVEAKKVGFIVRTNDWKKDIDKDRNIDVKNGLAEVWLVSGDENTYTSADQVKKPEASKFDNVTVKLHYFRYDNNYDGWNFWLWKGSDGKGKSYSFTGEDSFGKVTEVNFSGMKNEKNIGLIIRKSTSDNEFAAKDTNSDRAILVSKADSKGVINVYLMQDDPRVTYKVSDIDRIPKIQNARVSGMNRIEAEVNIPLKITEDNKDGFILKAGNTIVNIEKVLSKDATTEGYSKKFTIITKDNLSFNGNYKIHKEGYKEAALILSQVFGSKEFSDLFTYKGNDLGATYSKEKTSFRLWAPTTDEAKLVLYKECLNGSPEKEISMKKDINGTWVAVVDGDLKGKFYTFKVNINGHFNEGVDPYAKSVGANGLRAMVVDLSETNPEGWDKDTKPEFKNFTDAVIYEIHVRDLSMSKTSGIKNKGKYLGFAEKGTVSPEGEKTGIDHISDLGITHVHLMPSYDYHTIDETSLEKNEFNWGYDPQNYNVPEGSYSTDPYSGAVRIKEFKQAVKAMHENGLRVVMDVVYNHTFKADDSNLSLLVPDYYYRKDELGKHTNGSGCGNETASERSMVRKLIVDSLKYWVSEYHIDGFRFDLMGVHDIETMNIICEELNKIDPTILLYGEGWNGGSSPLPVEDRAIKANAHKINGIAVFSDEIRDGLKGNVFNLTDNGFVSGKQDMEETIKFGVVASTKHPQINYEKVIISKASYAKDPTQTVTYASCHDNNTLWDKLQISNPNDSEESRIKMDKLAQAIVFTSQGIPFMKSGEEFLITKQKVSDSVRSPDNINQLDWSRKATYKDIYEYYKGLITMRKTHPAFRMLTTEDVQKNLVFMENIPKNMVGYTLNNNANGDTWNTIAVLYNANKDDKEITLPADDWNIVVNSEKAGVELLDKVKGNKLTVPALTAMVLVDSKSPLGSGTVKNTIIYVLSGIVLLAAIAIIILLMIRRKSAAK